MKIRQKSESEFIIVMASLMSLVAFAIDALLPAISDISETIHIIDPKNNQLFITMIFLGIGFGQLISGPLSDSFGRKPIIYVGFSVFVLASFICLFATNLEMMIVGRFLQGIGLSAPRTISIAMVRDRFSGNYMARVMSFITVIFLLVPVIAPALGKILLDAYGWKSIFYSQLIIGVFIMLWVWKRQPETLVVEKRKKFKLALFVEGLKEFVKYKYAVIFTIFSGFITGSFMVYLSASQHIFVEQYQLEEEFPFIFACLAISIGMATFLNGKLVVRMGMFKLVSFFTIMFTVVSLIYILFFYGDANPNIYVLLIFFGLQFFSIGFLFGNTRALAMEPIGHIAGVGAAINGFVSTIMAVPIATFIGSYITDTALPLFIGFFVCGTIALLLILLLKLRRN
ncbi:MULTISPECIES: multidrug effflux MFS transporter [unclassified Polaribacter]|uniref:multidrug effflux MFS transporter n=1 Tax=unclassified Polaribacter TaxID=196858 RepID=UPI001C4E6B1D|nr:MULTISPECIES: multidrug effflux MFS transporter [unclassified Polaribacter]QXP62064.1 multidrug effflux MFS transporter [Polaribacter sp. HaHaR_3_91]QXP67816.1 multidrug effflux MFS transporter [Polaribacter sp. AHE13PA]QXP69982.1 multidrug effflux MFS transporter [Polaribacter sp. R2A056_3_33]